MLLFSSAEAKFDEYTLTDPGLILGSSTFVNSTWLSARFEASEASAAS